MLTRQTRELVGAINSFWGAQVARGEAREEYQAPLRYEAIVSAMKWSVPRNASVAALKSPHVCFVRRVGGALQIVPRNQE